MLEALKAAKLKKAETKDHSGPVLTEKLQEMDTDVYHNTILDFNIEEWVDLLGDGVTPHTEYFNIDLETAKKFLQAYEILVEKQQPLPEDLQVFFAKLAEDLQIVLDKVRGTDEYVFVKTSSRSAKNTITHDLGTLFQKALVEYKKENSIEVANTNDKLIALLRAGTEQMKTYSAVQCIEVFCRSERIHGDFEIAMHVPDRWRENFVIRKWVPMDCVMEFRTWVVDGRVTAISQYSNLIMNPYLVKNQETVKQNLLKFFEDNVKVPLLPKYSKYIIDYGFLAGSLEKIYVIEVNPFLPTTGSVLFDWADDADLLNGKVEGTAFRIREEIPQGILGSMIEEWRDMVNSAV